MQQTVWQNLFIQKQDILYLPGMESTNMK